MREISKVIEARRDALKDLPGKLDRMAQIIL
jgi:hypothetical protein